MKLGFEPPFVIQLVTVEQVCKVLNNISSLEATGAVGVSVRSMKLNIDKVSVLLTRIIKISIDTLEVLF